MPYIKQERRDEIALGDLLGQPRNPGELNYQLTIAIQCYLNYKGLTYATINDILGALEGAKLEFYRRIAVPYEDTKIKENGDVW